MMKKLSQNEVISLLKNHGIDWKTTFHHLKRYNQGLLPKLPDIDTKIPQIDGNQILDRSNLPNLTMNRESLTQALEKLSIHDPSLDLWIASQSDPLVFTPSAYESFGLLLMPWVSYGVLNGGMATSYCDKKKNLGSNPHFFVASTKAFDRFAPDIQGKPKALTPAYYNLDYTPGENFLYLKVLAGLQIALKRKILVEKLGGDPTSIKKLSPLFPFFQMTSDGTHQAIQTGLKELLQDDILQDLAKKAEIELGTWLTEIQPLLAAYTDNEREKEVFLHAWGKENTPLGLPGGHGQNFQVLQPVYEKLYDLGKRFVYLSNIDNLGATPDPGALAYLFLKDGDSAFDFSFKTKVDTKGGILVRTIDGTLTCGDIGPAISSQHIEAAEREGSSILFNCATGIFRLDKLIDQLPYIIESLPVRFSNQSKDAGNYSQAEQVTWEVLGLMNHPIIFGVNKFERFLAAKMITDSFITSGIWDVNCKDLEQDEIDLAQNLQRGLEHILRHQYGLIKSGNHWQIKNG